MFKLIFLWFYFILSVGLVTFFGSELYAWNNHNYENLIEMPWIIIGFACSIANLMVLGINRMVAFANS